MSKVAKTPTHTNSRRCPITIEIPEKVHCGGRIPCSRRSTANFTIFFSRATLRQGRPTIDPCSTVRGSSTYQSASAVLIRTPVSLLHRGGRGGGFPRLTYLHINRFQRFLSRDRGRSRPSAWIARLQLCDALRFCCSAARSVTI